MEDPINRSEEIFRKAYIMSPDSVNINRLSDGLYISVNEGFKHITGYSEEEIIGKTSLEVSIWVGSDDRDKLVRGLKAHGKVANLETRFRMKDGTIRYGMMSAAIIDIGGVPHILSLTRDITQRKEIEHALRESETRYRELIELAPDGILLGSHEGIITGANSKMLKISGKTLDELIGKSINVLFLPDELEKNPLRYDLVQKGESVTIERNILRSDGIVVPVEMHTKMMPDKTYQLICHDITGRRNSEDELRKLSRAVEQSPASIVITDTNGKIEYINQKLCDITGYSREELSGKNPRIWSSHEKTSEEYKEFWNTINAGLDWKGEFHNRKKSGELYWESATVSSIKNEKNEITHFLGIKEDITLRKILEEKTIASEQRYRELFLDNPIPSYIFDETTLEFIEVNDATVFNYGYSRDEFKSMTLKDIRFPEDVPGLLDEIKKLGKDVFHSTTMCHRRKNGTPFPVEITSHSLPEKNNRKARLVMAIDITESVKASEQMILAREKAEASDRLKTMFLNNISHEVRTPLNGILGFTEIISQTDLSVQDRKDAIAMLTESSYRLLNTITNYMDISLLTSGSMSVANFDFFPVTILKNLFIQYKTICTDRNLAFFLEVPNKSENLSVSSDKEIFQKIMTHLLDNAVKFTEKGRIHFGFKILEGNLEFYVKDTGFGISKDSLEKVFNRFTKEDNGPARKSEGSGLGLSIAKGMIEIIGSSIKVESEVGAGSTFSFRIPFLKQSKESFSSTSYPENKKLAADTLILVAEDDQTNFFYLKALLKLETGATVLHASDGREAIELFKANPDIGLILMDMKMPDIDGFEATKQIKQIRQDVPVIAITAYAMSGDKERVLAAGCDGYISKPISKKNLLKKMAEFVKI